MVKRKLNLDAAASPAKFAKLTSFGFSSPKTNTDNSASLDIGTPTKSPQTDSDKISKTPTLERRCFKETWKFNRPWLRYDASSKSMFCDICINAQVCNKFTTGCTIMKKESVVKHAEGKGNNSHARAIEIAQQTTEMDTAWEAAMSKNKSAIVSALKNVFFAAIHDLPNTTVPKLHNLCIEQGATQLQDLLADEHTSYTINQSIKEFQAAISQVLEDKLLDKIRESRDFSLMIDESTDISVHQNLLVYIRIVEEVGARWVPKSYFLGVRQLSSATAESVTKEVLGVVKDKGLELSNLVGISTDGAAVMVGCRSGVVTRLKETCPNLLSTHCIAHRLALGCGSGAYKVPYLVKFQDILNSIYKYFSYSPKHMAALVYSVNH